MLKECLCLGNKMSVKFCLFLPLHSIDSFSYQNIIESNNSPSDFKKESMSLRPG